MTAAPTATVTLDPTTHAALMGTSLVIASATQGISLYVDPATDPLDAVATLHQIGKVLGQLEAVFAAQAGVIAPIAAPVVPSQRVGGDS